MSFPVAVQSAIFYVVACTPCAKARSIQKAKVTSRKEREGKAKLETEQPGLYRHPSPFATNPYWQEEISMGPSLPKKSASKNSSQRGLSSSGRDSDAPSLSECTRVGDSGTTAGDSATVIADADGLSEDWNRRKGYQREDEELWGQWSGHKLKDAFSKARDSAGRLIENKLGLEKDVSDHDRRDFYFSPKNPPINDYHPPVVSSKAPRKDAHRWMLQPPPPAKIMEGKLPVSRAVSAASRASSSRTAATARTNGTSNGANGLSFKKESDMTEQELIEFLFTTRSNRSTSFTRARSMSLDGVDESAEFSYEYDHGERRKVRTASQKRRRQQEQRAATTSGDSDSSDMDGYEAEEEDGSLRPFSPSASSSKGLRPGPGAAARPKLETIASSGRGIRA
ncbi:hypothetical protein GMORB2_5742 [Geosmithia morbida]|uniref:Signal peptide-containing protein n=1 Tax=Geosmithia morbida TaxID=1094350 RepID=A0A9P4YVT8_9HYPO|nr:uncharacterized protein GMORB2_5742 [Geosmithia morbida]KAF4124026.1 hypothetical protein GMORB2_5742 [Geosmithia morbida]